MHLGYRNRYIVTLATVQKQQALVSRALFALAGRSYITRASALTTASMLRLLMAATQMRPESTP